MSLGLLPSIPQLAANSLLLRVAPELLPEAPSEEDVLLLANYGCHDHVSVMGEEDR